MPDFRLPAAAAGPLEQVAKGAHDRPVDRPVVSEAVRRTLTEAAALQGRPPRVAVRPSGGTDWDDPSERSSPELLRQLGQLRWSVTRYAQSRRAMRVPIERVVPEMKAVVREAESGEGWRDPADALMAQVVRWTIEGYYDEPALQHVPRFY
jgi:hypothetical protein